jgi:hypothetical protein
MTVSASVKLAAARVRFLLGPVKTRSGPNHG